MTEPPPSKTQRWFRDLSERLELSYRSSGRIEHRGTKGESRERQILDIFSQLLPTRISVQHNVVVIDSEDTESPKFDGVLFERTLWPLLWQQDTTMTAMLESVLAAIEIKSSIDVGEMADIFRKAALLRQMRSAGTPTFASPPLVTAFAYQCANVKLAFFDFATRSYASGMLSPSLVCILNQALFGLAQEDGGGVVPVPIPTQRHIPVLYETERDTLLMYLYFLSRWASIGSDASETLTKYSGTLFSNLTAFHFDRDFLDVLTHDAGSLGAARRQFLRHGTRAIQESYHRARRELGIG